MRLTLACATPLQAWATRRTASSSRSCWPTCAWPTFTSWWRRQDHRSQRCARHRTRCLRGANAGQRSSRAPHLGTSLSARRQGGPAQQYQQQREKQYHQQREGSSGLADLEPWYSFDEGLVHVVMLSSEHAPQRAWLAQDLAAVRRDRTPWVIVALHRPMYVTGLPYHADGYDYKVAQDLREAYEPLLLQHRVDLVLAGHHHSYQRTCSIANSSCVPPAAPGVPYGGPVHLVVGMGGYQNTPIFLPKKEFVVTDCLHHGFVRLDASRRVLSVEYLAPNTGDASPSSMRDEDCDCDVLDSFSLPVQPGLA